MRRHLVNCSNTRCTAPESAGGRAQNPPPPPPAGSRSLRKSVQSPALIVTSAESLAHRRARSVRGSRAFAGGLGHRSNPELGRRRPSSPTSSSSGSTARLRAGGMIICCGIRGSGELGLVHHIILVSYALVGRVRRGRDTGGNHTAGGPCAAIPGRAPRRVAMAELGTENEGGVQSACPRQNGRQTHGCMRCPSLGPRAVLTTDHAERQPVIDHLCAPEGVRSPGPPLDHCVALPAYMHATPGRERHPPPGRRRRSRRGTATWRRGRRGVLGSMARSTHVCGNCAVRRRWSSHRAGSAVGSTAGACNPFRDPTTVRIIIREIREARFRRRARSFPDPPISCRNATLTRYVPGAIFE